MSTSERRDRDILDNLYDGVYFVDRERHITYWNQGAERITGFTAARVMGQSCSDHLLLHVSLDGAELCRGRCPLAETLEDGAVREAEVFLHHADGHRVPVLIRVSPVRDPEGLIIGAVQVFSDNPTLLAAKRRAAEPDVSAAADPLTGLATRASIESKIRTLLVASYHRDPSLGVLLIDIDRFRSVNERFGREAGDRALKAVAATVRQGVRATDFVGRWGADEFVAVVIGVDRARVIMIANKLRAAVERAEVALGRGQSHVTVSIGATVARAGDTPETLLERAGGLLNRSKAAGRDEVSFGE